MNIQAVYLFARSYYVSTERNLRLDYFEASGALVLLPRKRLDEVLR